MKPNIALILLACGGIAAASWVAIVFLSPRASSVNSIPESVSSASSNSPSTKIAPATPSPALAETTPKRTDNSSKGPSTSASLPAATILPPATTPTTQITAARTPSIPVQSAATATSRVATSASGSAAKPQANQAPQPPQVAGAVQEIVVPAGVVLPALFSDAGENLSPPQANALDQIADEFLDTTVATNPGSTGGVPSQITPATGGGGTQPNETPVSSNPVDQGPVAGVLESGPGLQDATRLANERYRMLFGQDAFNRWTSQAAIEALQE